MLFPSPTAVRRFLLYATRSEIRGVDTGNPYLNIITALTVPDIDEVTAVDYDAAASEERIYWADVKAQAIRRAFINGTALETVVSGGTEWFGLQFTTISTLCKHCILVY